LDPDRLLNEKIAIPLPFLILDINLAISLNEIETKKYIIIKLYEFT